MKIKLLGVLTAGTALMVCQAQAGNLLSNPSFELPGIPITTGFANVPYWNYAPTPTTTNFPVSDSGIDNAWTSGFDGNWAAISASADAAAGVWANQDTGYALQAGDTLYLSLLAGQAWSFDSIWQATDSTLHYQIWTVQGGGPGVGAIYNGYFDVGEGYVNPWGGNFVQYVATISWGSIAKAEGETIGISIFNSSGLGIDPSAWGNPVDVYDTGSWIDFDEVILSTNINDVPEPETISLLTLGGLSALVVSRLRRGHIVNIEAKSG
jgi:hypothetical protein